MNIQPPESITVAPVPEALPTLQITRKVIDVLPEVPCTAPVVVSRPLGALSSLRAATGLRFVPALPVSASASRDDLQLKIRITPVVVTLVPPYVLQTPMRAFASRVEGNRTLCTIAAHRA